MKYLGITGVDMARKLSTFRSDDRKRAPETISRWISGKASIDAGVMAWIDQSVRIKAYEDAEAMVTFPADKKSLVIGIANIKNSFSVSLLALQTSAVATKSYQTLVTHVVCVGDKNHDLIRDQLRSLWIASLGWSPADVMVGGVSHASLCTAHTLSSLPTNRGLGIRTKNHFLAMHLA